MEKIEKQSEDLRHDGCSAEEYLSWASRTIPNLEIKRGFTEIQREGKGCDHAPEKSAQYSPERVAAVERTKQTAKTPRLSNWGATGGFTKLEPIVRQLRIGNSSELPDDRLVNDWQHPDSKASVLCLL